MQHRQEFLLGAESCLLRDMLRQTFVRTSASKYATGSAGNRRSSSLEVLLVFVLENGAL